jgi:hypothetical protein
MVGIVIATVGSVRGSGKILSTQRKGEAAMRNGSVGLGRRRWLQVWILVSAILMLGAGSAQAASSATTPLEPPTIAPIPTPDPSNLHALVPVDQYTVSRAEAEEAQSAESVEYYEQHFGVSSEVARSRLATQTMGAGLGSALRKQIGDAAT